MLALGLLIIPTLRDPQHKVDNNRRQKRHREHGRPHPIVKSSLAPHPDRLRSPMEREQGVYHRRHGHDGKACGRDTANTIAEVEEADRQTAEDDGEVEPGEEGALVCEEDFRFDAGGKGDAFAWVEDGQLAVTVEVWQSDFLPDTYLGRLPGVVVKTSCYRLG